MNEAQKLLKSIGVAGIRNGDGSEEDEVVNIEIEEEVETPEIVDEEPEAEEENSEEPELDDDDDDDDDSVIVTIGDEEPPKEDEEEKAPSWVKELRKKQRETAKENRELKEKLKAKEESTVKKVELGKKPTLEDHDYDAEAFEKELTAWYDRKKEVDKQNADLKAEQEAQDKAWQDQLSQYSKAKTELKVKDFDDAEATALETLDQTQQGIIVQGADNSALVIYALGKNEKKAKELSSIKDPVKFAFAVAKLEKDLKVTNRKAPPPPEKKITGTAPSSGSVDSTLERLRSEAEKTGNYTKVMAYKKQLKNKQRKK